MGETFGFEAWLLARFHGSWYPWSVYASDSVNVVPALALVYAYLVDRRRAYAVLAAVLLACAVTTVLKPLVGEPRPFEVGVVRPLVAADHPFWSFPSGHAARAFSLAAACTFERVGPWPLLWVWAVAVGVSRVTLGVHWPHDVVAGAAVGVVSAWYVRRTRGAWVRLFSSLDPVGPRLERWLRARRLRSRYPGRVVSGR